MNSTALRVLGVPPAQQAEALRLLVTEGGLEAVKGGVRVPLLEQLRAQLAARQMITAEPAPLARLLVGATGAEARAVADQLVKAGEARRIVRGPRKVVLALPRFEVLTKEQVGALGQAAEELAALCKGALRGPAPATLFWHDASQLLEGLRHTIPTPKAAEPVLVAKDPAPVVAKAIAPQAAAADQPAGSLEDRVVLAAARATLDRSVGLSFVPAAVQRLEEAGYGRGVVHEALLRLARQGGIELRPEAGVGRFSQEELDRCPPGPRGTRLVWARLGGRG
jgi:hypothetical protein